MFRHEEQAPPIIELVAHAYAHRRTVGGIFAAIFGMALVAAALLPPRYTATATLAVLPAPEFTVRENAGSREVNGSALAMDQIMKAETAILGSDELHAQAIQHLGLGSVYPDLVTSRSGSLMGIVHGVIGILLSPWLTHRTAGLEGAIEQALHRFSADLTVLPAKDGNVISVAFGSRDPHIAARIVNVMLADYALRRSRLYDDPQLEIVKREAEQAGRMVASADETLAAFKAVHRISSYEAERDMLLKRRNDGAQALADVASLNAEQRARIQALDRQMAAAPSSAPVYREVDSDTRLQVVDANLLELRGHLATTREHYRDESRMVTDIDAQITAREGERRRIASDPAPSVVRTGRTASQDELLLDRVRAAADLAAAQARAAVLGRATVDIEEELARLNSDETALHALQRRQVTAGESFASANRVLAERRLTEAEDASRLANVRVIQPARAPDRPGPMPQLVIVAGFLLAVASSMGWLTLRFLIRTTCFTPAGLAYATGLPVLASFPVPERAPSHAEVGSASF